MTLEELRQALEETATPEGAEWVRESEAAVAADPAAVRTRFPAAGRRAGRGMLDPGADPADVHAWTVDDAARVLILAAMGPSAEAELAELYRFGDAAERRGLLRALPFLELGDRGRPLVDDAVRTNDTRLVAAALGPYATEHLDDAAYDQAVLKCVFIGVPIAPLDGLPERATPETARMLAAFVHERVAAGGHALMHERGQHPGPIGRDAMQAVQRRDRDADEHALEHGLVIGGVGEVRGRVRAERRGDQPRVVGADRVLDEVDGLGIQVLERAQDAAALGGVAVAIQLAQLGPGVVERLQEIGARGVVDRPRMHVVRIRAVVERPAPDLAADGGEARPDLRGLARDFGGRVLEPGEGFGRDAAFEPFDHAGTAAPRSASIAAGTTSWARCECRDSSTATIPS